MHRVPQTGLTKPAVAAQFERGVRPHFAGNENKCAELSLQTGQEHSSTADEYFDTQYLLEIALTKALNRLSIYRKHAEDGALCILKVAPLLVVSAAFAQSQPKHTTPAYDVLVNVRPAGGSQGVSELGANALLPAFSNALASNGITLGESKTHRVVFDGFYLQYSELANLTVLSGALQLSRAVKVDGKEQWVVTCTDGNFNWRAGPDGRYERDLRRDLDSFVRGFVARCIRTG